jgi:hypothetical protein
MRGSNEVHTMDAPGTDAGPRRQSGPARYFSVPTAKALADAAMAFSEDPFAGDEALRNAIITAVSEAHAAGWEGSELITAIRAAVPAAALMGPERDALETTIRRRAMIAFFGANDSVF